MIIPNSTMPTSQALRRNVEDVEPLIQVVGVDLDLELTLFVLIEPLHRRLLQVRQATHDLFGRAQQLASAPSP
jgi:hypothetical protein